MVMVSLMASTLTDSECSNSDFFVKRLKQIQNKKWKSKFFLFPVDVRSARGALFVSEAILSALKAASDSEFITPSEDFAVDDVDNILSADSINSVLSELKIKGKVLIIFFDQFEEAFTKDELLPVFRAFRRLALEVSARQENLVLGFSWRTGVSLSDDNPAYDLWNGLRDHRLTKTLNRFDSGESSQLITLFEKHLGQKLLPPLRKQLHEQGQGLPWFLKKLCIHVTNQVERGISPLDLLGSRLNVERLFNEDLEPLTEAQLSCLHYIAENSPIESHEVYKLYGTDVLNVLTSRRLVVRAGERFAVYWDIFRDYLVDKTVPQIPWTYIPNCIVGMGFKACRALQDYGPLSTTDL